MADLHKDVGNIARLAFVAGEGKGRKQPIQIETPKGKHIITMNDIKSLVAEFGRKQADARKRINEVMKPVKGARRATAGFASPFAVADNFANFFRSAQLGNAANGQLLSRELRLLTDRATVDRFKADANRVNYGEPTDQVHFITNRNITSVIWPIYAQVNRLSDNAQVTVILDKNGNRKAAMPLLNPGGQIVRQSTLPEGEKNYSLYGADANMRANFAEEFAFLAARTPPPTKSGKPGLPFSPDCFSYVQFQSVISQCRIPENELSPTEAALLVKPFETPDANQAQLNPVINSLRQELATEHAAAKAVHNTMPKRSKAKKTA